MSEVSKILTLTEDDIRQFKFNIDQIERWRGESYYNDDEIGTAIQGLKTMLSCLVYGDFNESCPNCDEQLRSNKVDFTCPNCEETVIACSMCTMEYEGGCEGCLSGSHYDVDISQIKT